MNNKFERHIQVLKESAEDQNLRDYVERCAESEPGFFRWLFNSDWDDYVLPAEFEGEYNEFLQMISAPAMSQVETIFTEKYHLLSMLTNTLKAEHEEVQKTLRAILKAEGASNRYKSIKKRLAQIEKTLKIIKKEEDIEYNMCVFGKHHEHGEFLIKRSAEADEVF